MVTPAPLPLGGDGTSGPLSRSRERVRVRARAPREAQIDAEALPWLRLGDRRFADFKVPRQRPVGRYIADFVCIDAMLIVAGKRRQGTAALVPCAN